MSQNEGLSVFLKKGVIVFLIFALIYAIASLSDKETTSNQNSLSNDIVIVDGTPSQAEEATIVSISTSHDDIVVGDELIVRIMVEPNTTIAGMQFDIGFDPSLASASTVEEGDLLSQSGANTFFNPGNINNESGITTGVYGVVLGSGKGVCKEGTFAIITLEIGEKEAVCPITLSNVIVGDMNGESVPIQVVNGQVEIYQS